ncbi:MAG: 3-oxoacyl-ACP reductase FabG [Clostridia bacterium]|nr:3-oxoacyl-ACP reductase FabG [Clostridia bacterium]
MKTALITGASRGIGAAMARAFAEAGYAVALNYRQSEEKARRLAEELTRQGCVAACYRADVADPRQAEELVRRCEEELGQIAVLINNAGISADGLFTDLTDEVWRRLWEVNVSGTLYCSRAVLPAMIRRGSGVILTLSSMWGQVGGSCEVAYSATKAAVIGFTRALAQEVGPAGVRVNCLAPGVIDTDMNQVYGKEALDALAQETPLQRIGRPEEVAQLALWLASEKAGFITGQVIGVNGGFC